MNAPVSRDVDNVLQRALDRERRAREMAEELLEKKSRELFLANEELVSRNRGLHQRAAEIELLHAVALFARDSRPFKEVMGKFVEAVCRICDWPVGHVYVPDDQDPERLISLKVWHIRPGEAFDLFQSVTEAYRFKNGEGLPGRVWANGKPAWIEDIHVDSNFPRARVARDIEVKAAFAVAIRREGRIVAVAEFFASQAYQKDQQMLDLVDMAATQLGNALDRQLAETRLAENHGKLEKALSELQQAQAQLVQSEKMASLGQLAAGVAHEINNPIGFIMSNLSTLREYVDVFRALLAEYKTLAAGLQGSADPTQRAALDRIRDICQKADLDYVLKDVDALLSESSSGTVRIKEIVQNLKSFARLDEAEVQEADLNAGVEAVLKIVANELKYKCELKKDLGAIPPVRCYPGQLNQVFLNLLVNAAQAIPERGTITIQTHAQNGQAVIRISDTGTGIPPDVLPRIFDPFFTTKPVGKGTGLGLSIAHGIVEKHGGTIDVESAMGKGTTFTIRLPLSGVPCDG